MPGVVDGAERWHDRGAGLGDACELAPRVERAARRHVDQRRRLPLDAVEAQDARAATIDYCPLALIETKGWALRVAKELEERTAGRKLQPLTMHWSGCPASCGMHQVATIGLQGCRSRVNGEVVDAAHVCVKGKTGPNPVVATDLPGYRSVIQPGVYIATRANIGNYAWNPDWRVNPYVLSKT